MNIAETLKININKIMGTEVSPKRHFARRIYVSSNCQTGGIAAALQAIFPCDEITPMPLPTLSDDEAESRFMEKFKEVDAWVSIGGHDLLRKYGLESRVQLVKIPIVRFTGFHPDLVYVRRSSTNELIEPHYNSAIAAWAYKNGLNIDAAERLFCKNIFAELGYLDHWDLSILQLKQRFIESDLEFSDFILPMRREGVFMYSLNHPKAIALARLAKLISQKLGARSDILDKYIDINDGLNDVIWPLYPEIGDSLSLPSSYEWKMGEKKWICGLRAYLDSAYKNYISKKIAPNDLFIVNVNQHLYDHVLGAHAGGAYE